MGLDDDASATLALPSRTDVVAYAEASFVTVEEVSPPSETTSSSSGRATSTTMSPGRSWIGWYTGHSSRHLGMIEALKGVFGIRGTVTS
jgi:hypothetical protein